MKAILQSTVPIMPEIQLVRRAIKKDLLPGTMSIIFRDADSSLTLINNGPAIYQVRGIIRRDVGPGACETITISHKALVVNGLIIIPGQRLDHSPIEMGKSILQLKIGTLEANPILITELMSHTEQFGAIKIHGGLSNGHPQLFIIPAN